MKKVSDHILRRVYILMAIFIGIGIIILLRIAALQLDKDKWVQKEIDEQVFFKRMVADRGNILSEDGNILATSLPFYRLAMDPTRIDTTTYLNFRDSLYQLAVHLTNTLDEAEERDTMKYVDLVLEAIAKRDRHIYLHRKKLNFRELEAAQQWPILRWGRYQGGLVVEKYHNERFYPLGDLARITLGRLIDDTLAVRGIEYAYNRELRGRDGYILAQKVVGGSYVPLDQYGQEAAEDGYDVVTTLDVDMQDIVERALQRGVERHFAKYGTAILMDVQTGKILALANYPETYNHAVASQVEPGSTFKTASALALLEDGYLEICDTIDTGNGRIMYDDKEVTDHGLSLGKVDFEQVFAYSSNVGVSKSVNEFYGQQPERYIAYLRSFGFGDIMLRQLSGEPLPDIIEPHEPEWTIATLPSLSYGYSLRVTPIQMAAFYNGIANNGKLMRPWIVKEIRDDAHIVASYGPEVVNPQMVSEETIVKMNELMKAVVNYGTAEWAFRKMPFKVAGKTGTARKTERGVGYVSKYRASFGGYFPADAPRFTLYVMVDEPDGGITSGGFVAAPIFREVAEQIYRLDMQLSQPPSVITSRSHAKPAPRKLMSSKAQQIYPQLGIVTSAVPTEDWATAVSNDHQINLQPMEVVEGAIPDLRGMSARDAVYLLEKMGVSVTLRGRGRVRRQSLLPGYRVGENASITLFLG
ncbi:MAG: penicillin-binding protein [Bacteroidia bacterium]